MRTLPFLAGTALLTLPLISFGQCPPGEVEVTIAATTDNYGYEVYWELLPSGNACGNGTLFSGGNNAVGCNGAGAQNQTPGGYLNNTTYTEGPWCLTLGASYDIFWADDWGDGGLMFEVYVNGISTAQFTGTGAGQTFTFVAELPPDRDMAVTKSFSPLYAFEGEDVTFTGEVKSFGAVPVTSFDLNYQVTGGPVVTAALNGMNLNAGETWNFTHPTPWTPAGNGPFEVTLWCTNINGGSDLVPGNDELMLDMVINAPIPNIIDDYLSGTPVIVNVAGVDEDLLVPRDLDFHPDLARNEVWVINKETENSGGSTVTFYDATAPDLVFEYRKDGNAWHFMSLPTGIAMGDNNNFATSPGVFDANHNGPPPFTGPSLWSCDTAVYARPSGGNGSHLDMLHVNPECQGIAHESANVYWVTDGFNGDVTRCDFQDDHGPGNDDHTDAIIRRYTGFSITKDPNDHIVSHLVLDKATNWLYVVDHGADRVLRLDITTGTPGGTPSWPPGGNPYEPYEEYSVVNGYTWEEIITTGLVEPAGIDVIGDRLLVSDHANGDIIVYDISGTPVTELGRIVTNSPGIMGIKIGPDGRIWAVNASTHELIVIDPDGFSVGLEESAIDALRVYPNPASDQLVVMLDSEAAQRIELLDATGRLVQAQRPNTAQATLDVQALPAGTYVLRALLRDGSMLQERVVIAR